MFKKSYSTGGGVQIRVRRGTWTHTHG